jgi:hypothetical protein
VSRGERRAERQPLEKESALHVGSPHQWKVGARARANGDRVGPLRASTSSFAGSVPSTIAR